MGSVKVSWRAVLLALVVMAEQAAGYVDKTLRGAKPGDLPVDQPTRYELYVTSRRLGLLV
jgi:putative ABC transport system substrate-binding protein